jgi:hypothetical protein
MEKQRDLKNKISARIVKSKNADFRKQTLTESLTNEGNIGYLVKQN